jgi:hypothetical protein
VGMEVSLLRRCMGVDEWMCLGTRETWRLEGGYEMELWDDMASLAMTADGGCSDYRSGQSEFRPGKVSHESRER